MRSIGAKAEIVPVNAVVLPGERTVLHLCDAALKPQSIFVADNGEGVERSTISTNKSPRFGLYVKGTVNGI